MSTRDIGLSLHPLWQCHRPFPDNAPRSAIVWVSAHAWSVRPDCSARQLRTGLLRSLRRGRRPQGVAVDGEVALGFADVSLCPIRPRKKSVARRPMLPPELGADVGKHLQMLLMIPGEA